MELCYIKILVLHLGRDNLTVPLSLTQLRAIPLCLPRGGNHSTASHVKRGCSLPESLPQQYIIHLSDIFFANPAKKQQYF